MLFIKTLFNKIKFYLLGILVVYSLSVTGLYLHSQNTSIKLEGRLKEATKALKEQVEGRKKDKEGYEQDMQGYAALQKALKKKEAVKSDLISQIEAMSKEECSREDVLGAVAQTEITKDAKPKNIVKLNDGLPPSLTRVLDDAYQSGAGTAQ